MTWVFMRGRLSDMIPCRENRLELQGEQPNWAGERGSLALSLWRELIVRQQELGSQERLSYHRKSL